MKRTICMTLWTSLLLHLSGDTILALEPAQLKTDINWASFLARHDMVWTKLPRNWREAPWTGNGMIGSMSWVEGDALRQRYKKVRVIGLYWDQGESDQKQAEQYEGNLRDLFAALRRDTGIPDLQIYVREQGIFQYDLPEFQPIVEAQIKICKEDANTHLLELDLGSNEKNFQAWAWTDRNGHLSSKTYLELSRRILGLDKQVTGTDR